MFIGHFAVGFAARRAAPSVSLGVLIGAALLLDLLWPVCVLAGIERVEVDPGNTAFTPLAFVYYPISHSLLAAGGWALAAALIYRAATRNGAGAAVVGLAVASHWFLDALTHRPDLPLYPGSSTYAGLGLWNSVPGTLAVEGAMYLGAVWLYWAGTHGRGRARTVGLATLVTLLAALYIAGIVGPPPPSGRAVAVADLLGFVFIPWAAWLDRYSERKGEAASASAL